MSWPLSRTGKPLGALLFIGDTGSTAHVPDPHRVASKAFSRQQLLFGSQCRRKDEYSFPIPRSSHLSPLSAGCAVQCSKPFYQHLWTEGPLSFSSLSFNVLVNIEAILTMLSEVGGTPNTIVWMSCNIPSPKSHQRIVESLKQCHCLSNGQNVIVVVFAPNHQSEVWHWLRCPTHNNGVCCLGREREDCSCVWLRVTWCVISARGIHLWRLRWIMAQSKKSSRFRSNKCLLSPYKVPSLLLWLWHSL